MAKTIPSKMIPCSESPPLFPGLEIIDNMSQKMYNMMKILFRDLELFSSEQF